MEAKVITTHNGTLALDWRYASTAEHAQCVAAAKAITGATFSAADRCWYVPAKQADRLFAAFPQASYDYAAICAVVDAQRRRVHNFASFLVTHGVTLEVRGDTVVAHGDNVSPLVQKLVAERSAEIRAWLASHNARRRASGRPESHFTSDAVYSHVNAPKGASSASSEDLAKAELLAKSLRNAARNQAGNELLRQSRRKDILP
jgi:hypothetical protein